MMKAFVFSEYGSTDVLNLRKITKPTPKADEVLVKIHASSINDWDWALMTGDWVNRLFFGLTKPKKVNILGLDVAGVVEAIGEHVENLNVGDRVHADLSSHGFGGYAEYVCASANEFTCLPPDMTFEEAAALPHSGMLAYQTLIDNWELKDGQKILINGAGGGVGPIALQIAKQYDVHVTGVDSKEKLEMMKVLGFDEVIDYKKTNFTKLKEKYDLIFDVKTLQSPMAFSRVLKKGGKYLTVGGPVPKILSIALYGALFTRFTKKTYQVVVLKPNKNLNYINNLFDTDKLKLLVDGPYPFEKLPEAMKHYESGKQLGRIVITMTTKG